MIYKKWSSFVCAALAVVWWGCAQTDDTAGITTTESGQIAGRVVDAQGDGEADVLVVLRRAENTRPEVGRDTTDALGAYLFDSLAAGTYVLGISRGGVESEKTVELGANERLALDDVVLDASRSASSSADGQTSSSVGDASSASSSSSAVSSSSAIALSASALVSARLGVPMGSLGAMFGLAIDDGGTLFSWGSNWSGELGRTVGVDRDSVPYWIGGANWTYADAGDYFGLGIQTDGSLWTWGDNVNGQLGRGDTLNAAAPVRVGTRQWLWASAGGCQAAAIDADGHLWAWGGDSLRLWNQTSWHAIAKTPVQIGTDTWAMVAAGPYHYLAIRSDSTLWAWGDNTQGQLGQGDRTTRTAPMQIGTQKWIWATAGLRVSMALRADSTLWVWGGNDLGQLGTGTTAGVQVPTQLGNSKWIDIHANSNAAVGVLASGELYAWGTFNNANEPVAVGASAVLRAQVSDGTLLYNDGTLWTQGSNLLGMLGNGTTTATSDAVRVALTTP